ncbi:MAG: 2-polyprenyl-3-methyl-6-methoxy-1,4-benzoquinone monooxygenase [Pseudomonadota bacterium]
MTETTRHHSPLDQLLARVGDGLKTLSAVGSSQRPRPHAEATVLSEAERSQSAALMRVNHAGEVAAQGLYHGQALVARDPLIRQQLLAAAREEQDHLQWCNARLAELGDGPSKLSPLWYAGSAAIGALAGLRSDAVSLGFVAETERQVSAHLGEHLQQLPAQDAASRAVVQAMKTDEERHGQEALDAGGQLPPAPVRAVMRLVAGVMKFGAARV